MAIKNVELADYCGTCCTFEPADKPNENGKIVCKFNVRCEAIKNFSKRMIRYRLKNREGDENGK